MHTTRSTQARVYLHPALVTSPIAIRAIEYLTGRVAYAHPAERRVRLVTRAERVRLAQPGGAA